MSVARDVQVRLQNQNIIDDGTWQSTHEVFIDDQDKLVVFQSASGPEPGHRTGEEFSDLQIFTRGAKRDPKPPRDKMRDIRDDLDPLVSVTLNGTDYVNVKTLNEVSLLEQDDQGRPVFSQTFRLER